jgi:hypothetical protein
LLVLSDPSCQPHSLRSTLFQQFIDFVNGVLLVDLEPFGSMVALSVWKPTKRPPAPMRNDARSALPLMVAQAAALARLDTASAN